jgi:hypothetical protein
MHFESNRRFPPPHRGLAKTAFFRLFSRAIGFWPFLLLTADGAIASDLPKNRVVARRAAARARQR